MSLKNPLIFTAYKKNCHKRTIHQPNNFSLSKEDSNKNGKNKINRSTRKKKRKEKRHERNLSDSYRKKKKGNERKLVEFQVARSKFLWAYRQEWSRISFSREPQHHRVHVFRISPLEDLILFIFTLWCLRFEKRNLRWPNCL